MELLFKMILVVVSFGFGYFYRAFSNLFEKNEFYHPPYNPYDQNYTPARPYTPPSSAFNAITQFRTAMKGMKRYEDKDGTNFVTSVFQKLDKVCREENFYGHNQTTADATKKTSFLEKFRQEMMALKSANKELSENDLLRYDYTVGLLKNLMSIDTSKTYAIVGYGSLLSSRSAERTIKKPLNRAHVIIKNWERIFNLNHKQFDGAVLNVRPKENSKINAELIEIDYNDLAQFFIREFSYDFAEIPLTEIDMSLSPSDKAFTAEFAYMCVSRYDDRKEPLAHYLKTCMYSCKNVSVQALDMFVDSSIVYHLDQEMTVRDYLFKIYGDKGIELFSTNDGGY